MLFQFLPLDEGCSVSTAAFMLIHTRIEFLPSAKSVSATKRAVFLSVCFFSRQQKQKAQPFDGEQSSHVLGTVFWFWRIHVNPVPCQRVLDQRVKDLPCGPLADSLHAVRTVLCLVLELNYVCLPLSINEISLNFFLLQKVLTEKTYNRKSLMNRVQNN